ncbi:GNAT family N-acetyltransferase [Gleimia hominis]|uniref:GNAT family N-acetyltransferase n=1 Tax=Gleimia hominis TaxID=595468 RepID=UPI000C7FB7BC|nr:GNAT family N-acetyltransferase [Gleimia hominis]WIK65152.1 GNAT family N-acetyltransferase [Gleimia hominis]
MDKQMPQSYGTPDDSGDCDLPRIPDLPDIPDVEVTWRALTRADVPSLAKLIDRIERHDALPYRTSESEVDDFFTSTAKRVLVGGVVDGILRAFGFVHIREQDPNTAICLGGVDPTVRERGIGGALVKWQTVQARELLGNEGASKTITFHVEQAYSNLEPRLNELGYGWAWSFYDMRAELTGDLPQVGPTPFLTVRPWQECAPEKIHELVSDISISQGASSPPSHEMWTIGGSSFKPEWSFVAVDTSTDRHELVGFLKASQYPQDWSALGWREGTIDMLGVRSSDESVAQALLAASMAAQQKDGMQAVSAGFASINNSAISGVFERVGFETVGSTRCYTLQYDPPQASCDKA